MNNKKNGKIINGVLNTFFVFIFCLLVGPIPLNAQVNLVSNGGFEQGNSTLGWWSIANWTSGAQWGGMIIGTNNAHGGTNVMRMFAFGTSSQLLEQRFPASAGVVYEVDGYLRTMSGSQAFAPTNGYVTLLLQFYDSSGVKIGANVDAPRLIAGGPTTWTRITTGPALAPAGTVTARVGCLYYGGGDLTTSGWVELDSIRAYTSTPTQVGTLKNPDFEVQPYGTMELNSIPYWTPFGNAGAQQTDVKRSGRSSLLIWWQDNWVGQTWPATAGNRYASEGYVYTPSANPFRGSTNQALQALVTMQFFDSAGNQVGAYASTGFTTNSPKDTWTLLRAEGVAPVGTVTGRTFIGILGTDSAFGGEIYFDDLKQQYIPTGTTTNGLLLNYGFEDGPAGNVFDLDEGDMFNHWTWFGGEEAGFVVDDTAHSGSQSLTIVWPGNLAGQTFAARTGLTYVVEGYMMTPSGVGRMTSETAYATILLEFFNSVGGTGESVSAVSTLNLTKDTPADTWVKFSVTNRAPWTGTWVTGRVMCAVLDDADGAAFGGQVYFDTLKVSVTTVAVNNTQSGVLWNPGYEYTARGTKLEYIDNWKAFGDAGGVGDTYKRSGNNAVQIFWQNNWVAQDWPATAGYKYKTEGYVFTPSGNPLNAPTNASEVKAVVALLYLDTNGLVIGDGFVSQGLTSSSDADTWTLQTAEGWAPEGTVTARTFVGISGTDDGFTGEVWFDDFTQVLVSTGGTSQSGLLYNPGFEDGPTGNAFDLYALGWLPAWTWAGGDNAGFIGSDYSYEGDQALVITYPQNGAYQEFTVTSKKQSSNLLANPGFEVGPAGGAEPPDWWRGGAVGQEFWAYQTGTNGVAFYGDVPGNWGFLGQTLTVDSDDGEVFTFSINALAEADFASSANETYMKIEFWVNGEGANRYAVTNNIYDWMVANPDEWFTYTLAHTNSDPDVNQVKVLFGYGNAVGSGGSQAVKWDNASLVQSEIFEGARTYVASGYLFTPSSARFTSDGSSFGEITLSFYVNGATEPAQEFTVRSAQFGYNRPADQWIYFAVTGTAPVAATVTGRVSALIFSPDPGGDFDLGGVIWFDGLSLNQVSGDLNEYEQWQMDNFSSTTAPNTAPNEDYDEDGFSNWGEFMAGTDPKDDDSFLALETQRFSNNEFVVRWPSVAGRQYSLRRYTNLVHGSSSIIASGIAATPTVNVYTDSVPSAVESYYYRVSVTNSP